MQPEIFQGRGGFVELGHFHKHFAKNARKDLVGKHFFLPDTVKTTFWMENLTQKIDTIRAFFSKIRGQGRPPPAP